MDDSNKDFFDNAPFAFHSVGEDGIILRVNRTWVKLLGYSREEVEGKMHVRQILDESSWPVFDRSFSELQKAIPIQDQEITLVKKDGGRIRVLLGVTPVLSKDGHFVRSRTVFVDLSERIHAEERFAQLLEVAPDAMIVSDQAGTIRYANLQAERLFGYSRAELIGTAIEILVPESLRMPHLRQRQHFFKEPTTRVMGSGLLLRGRHRDGSEVPIEISLGVVDGAEGRLVVSAVRDVSERLRLAEESRRSGEKLFAAIESIQDAFALFDENERLEMCNSAFRLHFAGYIPGELKGRSFPSLLDDLTTYGLLQSEDASAEEQRDRWLAYYRNPESQPQGCLDLRTQGGHKWRVIVRRTTASSTVMTLWDLTQDLLREEELRSARREAEAASAAKSEFLASMSHELRTPLNSILGFSQLLLGDQRQPLVERQRKMLAYVVSGGEHLLQLIDDVLDLARIERGGTALSMEAVEVLPLLAEVRDALSSYASRAEVEIFVRPPSTALVVYADRLRLRQVLLNYVSNAIKYGKPTSPSGNRRDDGICIDWVQLPDRVRIRVTDRGPGIAKEKQGRLFQPFYRAGQEAGRIEGTGIGLTICARLADLMKGHVGFQSSSEGSMFYVEVPLFVTKEVAPEPQGDSATPVPSSGSIGTEGVDLPDLSVLYVEDNPANVALMEAIVATLPWVSMTVSGTAETGLEMAQAHPPDVVLLDLNLPGMGGIHALGLFRQILASRTVPIVAVSAAAMESDKNRASAVGFDRYITKPFKVAELVSALQEFRATKAAAACYNASSGRGS